MEEGLKVLKDIGAQQIHKDTHISKEHVQALIHGSCEGLNKIQFQGFVSILEKQYKVDLSDLKLKGKEHFEDVASKSKEDTHVFVTPEKEQNLAPLYMILAIIVFVSVAYYSFGYLRSMATDVTAIDNSQIEDAKKLVSDVNEEKEDELNQPVITTEDLNATESVSTEDANVSDENLSSEESVEESLQSVEDVVEDQEPEVVRSLKILPKNRIWAGYINIKTNQKYQKIFRKEFAVDVTEDWLLLFGSGTINLEVNGKNKTFSSHQNMRFKYIDGKFSKISVDEFKILNRGRKW